MKEISGLDIIKICQEEIKLWEENEEHDLDFCIAYKDVAYENYKQILEWFRRRLQ